MEVLVDNRNGVVWDMPVSSFTWTTNRIGKAGVFKAKLIIDNPLDYPIDSGAVIRVKDEPHNIFYGFIFSGGSTRNGEVSITGYDQLRYLMNNDTFVLPALSASQAIKKIASEFGLKVGTFEDTGYIVPGIVEDDKQALDVATKYLDSTLIATNQNFVLFDDFGSLTLKNINNMAIQADDFYIGEESLLFDFDYEKSIDKETYNRVKLVHDNDDTGKREVYIVQDSANIAKWGRLQKFRKVDANMEPEQIKDLANQIIALQNKETKKLNISSLGDWKVRAGRMVYLYIEKLGFKEYFMVDECKHDWSEGVHTMKLKMKVI
ncbi:XkdQ/YqbQ family protein [Cytobacillus sp. Hm23]